MVLPSADSVFYDPFAYADGSVLTNSAFLWDNRSGMFGQCQIVSSQLEIGKTNTEDIIVSLVGGPFLRSNNIVLYASFKINAQGLPKSTPEYFAHFVGGNANHGRVYAGVTNAGPGGFRLFVANGSDTTTMLPTDLNTNTSYLVVTRYDIDSTATTLWLNPTAESDPNVTATDTPSVVSIASYGFREDSGLGTTILIDDLRVGLSFGAVVSGGSSISSIPLIVQPLPGRIVLSWADPAFVLQSAPAVSGPYNNVTGASSPYTNTVAEASKFFRLKAN
jgi:hypothetical protein